MEMKRWRTVAAAGLLGVVLGAAGLRWAETFAADQALAARQAELTRLEAELKVREQRLTEQQTLVTTQAGKIRDAVAAAGDQADRSLAAQGTALDRLKKVLGALRLLREEVKGQVVF